MYPPPRLVVDTVYTKNTHPNVHAHLHIAGEMYSSFESTEHEAEQDVRLVSANQTRFLAVTEYN